MKKNGEKNLFRRLILPTAVLTALFAPQVMAQTIAKPAPDKLTNGGSLAYAGDTTRVGLGVDDDRKVHAEISHVFAQSDKNAVIGDLYLGRNALGLKLSYAFVNNDWRTTTSDNLAVTKIFGALDQNRDHDRKLTLGVGREWQNLFADLYVSHTSSESRLTNSAFASSVATQTGSEGGRPFTQDITTAIRTNTFTRPYNKGLGVRVGKFFDEPLLRATLGADAERGENGAKQNTVSVNLEKYFYNSPVSVSLGLDRYSKSGTVDSDRSGTRALLTVRYDFGGKGFRATTATRTVQVARAVNESVVASNSNTAAAVAAASAAAAAAGAAATSGSGSTTPGTPVSGGSTTQYRTEQVQSTVRRDLSLLENFAFKGSSFNKDQIATIQQFAKEVKASSCPVDVTIQGYACPYGNEQGNIAVSKLRAEAMRKLLIAEGVSPDRIKAEGLGGKSPRYPTADARNRRVEAQVTGGVCEIVTKEVRTPIVNPATTQPVIPNPVVQPTATIVSKAVMEDKIENVPVEPAWLRRALLTPMLHKTRVDTYSQSESTTAVTNGARVFQNTCPVATDDVATLDSGAVSTINVLANDSDIDPATTLTVTAVTQPTKGVAAIVTSNNRITYTSRAGTSGADSFTYTVSDGVCTRTATVRLTVNPPIVVPPPPPPVENPTCVNDTYVINSITFNGFNPLENDVTKNPPLRIVSVTQPSLAGSTVVINANGTLNFQALAVFDNTFFRYTARDAVGGTCTGIVTIIDP